MLRITLIKRFFVLFIIFIFSFFVGIDTIHAQDSKCFNKTTGQFTTWAECLGGIQTVNYGYQYNFFKDNPLYTGFVENFYMSYFNEKYNGFCSSLNWDCQNKASDSIASAQTAFNLTSNRLIADVFFVVISIILVIFVVKLIIAVTKYAAAGDSEEVVKTQKKVIRSMLVGLGIIVVFLIVAEIITNILGLGNFWEVGFRLRL